jgi:hypothetical protein
MLMASNDEKPRRRSDRGYVHVDFFARKGGDEKLH